MSLINKMLQDLDARGSQSGAAVPSDVRPVMIPERRLPVLQIAIGAAVLVSAMALTGYFWLKGRAPAPVPTPVAVVVTAPVVVPVTTPTIKVGSAAPVQTAVAVAEPLAPEFKAAPVAIRSPESAFASAPAPAPAPVSASSAAPVSAPAPAPALSPAAAPKNAERVVRVIESDRIIEAVAPALRTSPLPAPLAGGRDMNNGQKAESQYRQATAALDEGRVAAAMDGMEQALRLNPRHDAARQSLVALLIEAGRNDDAIGQLEQGLAADAGQTSLAMLLARMQIERGASGVATLQRSLPAAQGNGEYLAFLAGALQREGRHREAVEQYSAALRTLPEQGVWLMGLGISLQAEKRNAEALAAFQRAKATAMLTPQLLAFVERKIQALGQ